MIRRFRIVRGLRFRLMLSYTAFFLLLLFFVGLFFRGILIADVRNTAQDLLNEQWDAAKGYLSIENYRPHWEYNEQDQEERPIVDGLKAAALFYDANGTYIDGKAIGTFSKPEILGIISAKEPTFQERKDADGTPYLIKAWVIRDEKKRPYFFAMSRTLAGREPIVTTFTEQYFLFLPLLVLVSGALGWLVAGRALDPLNSVAAAAQGMTGSNLGKRLESRNADDELDHLIESFNHMTARLQQSFEQIRRFSTDVSHELRTPLTAIQGQLEVALFTAKTEDQLRDAMANALEDTEKLSSIVRALLLLSQAESGQVVLQRSEFDLAEVAADIADQFQIPAQEKRIELVVRGGSAPILADRTQIERLVSNLLSNAIKYTPQLGKVRVGISQDGSDAVFEVEDSGVGIAEENLPHIFDRFYRVRNAETNKIQGLGLGLSFVSWIVSAHGGSIDVDSTVGRGTRFRVRLPLAVPTSPTAESTPAQPYPQSPSYAG